MTPIDVSKASFEDLPALARSMGQEAYFTERLALQAESHGVLLVAWKGGVPVGDVYIWLAEPEEPELRHHLPGVPLLTHLEVVPEERNKGIGSRLMKEAEERLTDARHTHVALGVDPANIDAQRLYRRLGFGEWAHGEMKTHGVVYHPDGTRETHVEACLVMVKQLDDGKSARQHHDQSLQPEDRRLPATPLVTASAEAL